MTEQAEWIQKALRSHTIALKITDLLNDLSRIAGPDSDVYADILGPGFTIRGHGTFRVDSLLSTNDLRQAAELIGRDEERSD